MVQSDQGFAPKLGLVEETVDQIVGDAGESLSVDIETLLPLIDSANASPSDWNRICDVIAKQHDAYDGFVVTHGTDTLAYTAAAIGFALKGLKKPVIVTGAMLPLSVDGSDGLGNLTDALDAATKTSAGVWVQFAGQLMHGARTRKSHSTEFDAFRAMESDQPPVHSAEMLTFYPFGSFDVAILAVAPGMPDYLFDAAASKSDGLVLRCYGSGTAPENDGFRNALLKARDRDIPVLAVSQCPEGGMALGTYAAGAILRDNGVIDGKDMTLEAAYVKLLHVLSSGENVQTRLRQSICGELAAAQ